MRSRHLISKTTVTDDGTPWVHQSWIYNLTKIRLGSSPSVVKHPPDLTLTRVPGAFFAQTRVFAFTGFDTYIQLFQ